MDNQKSIDIPTRLEESPNDYCGLNEECRTAFQNAVTALEQPEQKKGKWIFVHPLQKDDSGAYMCSCCKNGDWDIKLTDSLCKFCGAKIEGEIW